MRVGLVYFVGGNWIDSDVFSLCIYRCITSLPFITTQLYGKKENPPSDALSLLDIIDL